MPLCLVANVGSLGSNSPLEISDANAAVRQNIINACFEVLDKHKRPDVLCLQESKSSSVILDPFFNGPITSNSTTGVKIPRGVCQYVNPCHEVMAVDTGASCTEITAVIVKSRVMLKRAKGHKIMNTAFINSYRNIHKDDPTSLTKHVSEIERVCHLIRNQYNTRNQVIVGDFNATSVKIKDFREITHPRLYYQQRQHTAKRKIDKVFCNFENCRIIDVLQTLENKEDKQYGHKAYLIQVGNEPTHVPKTVKIVALRKIKALLKNNKDVIKSINSIANLPLGTSLVDKVDLLIKTFQLIKNLSSITRTGRRKAFTLDTMADTKELFNKNTSVAKNWYKYYANFKSGIGGNDNLGEPPTLNSKAKKLSDKLANLNSVNRDIADTGLNECFERANKISAQIPSRNEFRRHILSVGNSGALDVYGLSLKVTKCILKHSKTLRAFMYDIFTDSLESGELPPSLKVDQITFLYKRKGAYDDPANWRPITIAPALAKHLDKVFASILTCAGDGNPDNNAYTAGKSCQSAMISVQKAYKRFRKIAKNDPCHDYVVVDCAEDISSAFESIDSVLIQNYCHLVFTDNDKINMSGWLKSYLDRTTFAVESLNGGPKVPINKKYSNRSSPQGSVLSPRLWRIFDGVFTHIYKRELEKCVEKYDNIIEFVHISYADDHMTIALIRLPKGLENSKKYKHAAAFAKLARTLLDFATKSVGCGVNAKKSEIIITANLCMDNLCKSEFVWLGYSLRAELHGGLTYMEISDKKAKQKIEHCKRMLENVFQYTKDVTVRWRLYKVYICPIIECYLPTYFNHQWDKRHPIAVFQHKCLCAIISVKTMSPITAVEKALGEISIINKTYKMCKRFGPMLGTELNNQVVHCNRLRGSEKIIINGEYIDKYDFCDRILTINEFRRKSRYVFEIYGKFNEKHAVDSAKSIRRWCVLKIKRIRSNSI